jgi:hypothetical protein
MEFVMILFIILVVYIFLRSLFKGSRRRRGGGYTYWHDSRDTNEGNIIHAPADENEMEAEDAADDDD